MHENNRQLKINYILDPKVNGKVTIESVPGKGTTIQAQIPLAAVRAVGRVENSLMGFADTKL